MANSTFDFFTLKLMVGFLLHCGGVTAIAYFRLPKKVPSHFSWKILKPFEAF